MFIRGTWTRALWWDDRLGVISFIYQLWEKGPINFLRNSHKCLRSFLKILGFIQMFSNQVVRVTMFRMLLLILLIRRVIMARRHVDRIRPDSVPSFLFFLMLLVKFPGLLIIKVVFHEETYLLSGWFLNLLKLPHFWHLVLPYIPFKPFPFLILLSTIGEKFPRLLYENLFSNLLNLSIESLLPKISIKSSDQLVIRGEPQSLKL